MALWLMQWREGCQRNCDTGAMKRTGQGLHMQGIFMLHSKMGGFPESWAPYWNPYSKQYSILEFWGLYRGRPSLGSSQIVYRHY